MRLEADAMRACGRAGLAVPEVLVDDDGALLGTAGLVMAHVAGRDARAQDPARRRVRRRPRTARRRPRPVPRRPARDRSGRSAGRGRHRRAHAVLGRVRACSTTRVPTFEKALRVARRQPAAAHRDDDRARRPAARQHDRRRPTDSRPRSTGSSSTSATRSRTSVGCASRRGGSARRSRSAASERSTSSSPRTKRRVAVPSIATRCTGGSSRRPCSGAWAAWARPPCTSAARCGRVELAAIGRRVAEQEWDLIELLAPDEWNAGACAPLRRAVARRRGRLRTADRARAARRGAALPHRRRHARDDGPHVVPCPGRRQHARHRRARARAGPRATGGRRLGDRSRSRCATSSPSPTRSTWPADADSDRSSDRLSASVLAVGGVRPRRSV